MAIEKHMLGTIKNWTESEWTELKKLFPAHFYGVDQDNSIKTHMEGKFDNGIVCPHCGKKHIVKNGINANGRQRYLCKNCHKSFVMTSGTVLWHSHLSPAVWDVYVGCMKEGLTIQDAADRCGVSKTTSFLMRHRIMEVMDSMTSETSIGGIVEADGTYYAYSLKGDRVDRVHTQENRDSHKRGKEDAKRGLSNDKVCVVTAMNRNKVPVLVVTGRATPSAERIVEKLKGRIQERSVLCTDNCNEYNALTSELKLEHHKIPAKVHADGEYHIQNVNNLHSKLRRFMANFNGVASKYLYRYVAWFNVFCCNNVTNAESVRIVNSALTNSTEYRGHYDYTIGRDPQKNKIATA